MTRRNDREQDQGMWSGLPPQPTAADQAEETEPTKGSRADQHAHEDSWYQVLRRLRDRREDGEPPVPA